ncbi:hypothetical protein EYV94_24770 [Puteibacter caeruleilacunae]|nr:hypothetical protein EYV94_24770 [Puteibacter caeruleilacunae]
MILILSIVFAFCRADEPRQNWKFRSKNGLYVLKLSESKVDTIKDEYGTYQTYRELKWGLYNSITKKLKYELPGPISQRTAYISNNGKYVVVVNDWPPEQADDSLELIMIYKHGELSKTYKLSDLMDCGFNISSSVGHFNWTWGKVKVRFVNKRIEFQTTELVSYKINIKNGKIEEKKINPNITDESILVYGQVFRDGKGKYRLETCHCVYGQIDASGIVQFNSHFEFHGGWYYTVLINNGQEVRIKRGFHDLHDLKLNSCTFEFEKLGIEPELMGFGDINCN